MPEDLRGPLEGAPLEGDGGDLLIKPARVSSGLRVLMGGLETQISETTDAIETLKGELAALAQKIKDLDAMVAEATDTRKDEHALFVQTSAENNAALQLLEVAKNRLNKFYNPAVYKAPPKRELTEEERIYVSLNDILAVFNHNVSNKLASFLVILAERQRKQNET